MTRARTLVLEARAIRMDFPTPTRNYGARSVVMVYPSDPTSKLVPEHRTHMPQAMALTTGITTGCHSMGAWRTPPGRITRTAQAITRMALYISWTFTQPLFPSHLNPANTFRQELDSKRS